MFTAAFWRATVQRMIRAAAAAVAGAYFGGDLMFDVLNINGWRDVLTLAGSTAVGTLLLCLAGDALTSGDGPAFGTIEITSPPAPPIGD